MKNEFSPCLHIQKGAPFKTGTCIAIDAAGMLIGRGFDLPAYSSLVFEEHFLSRRHVQITVSDGKAFAKDLGSKNGTILNGSRLEPEIERELHDGDMIRLADNAVVLQYRASASERLETPTLPVRGNSGLITNISYSRERGEFRIGTLVPDLSPKLFSLFLLLFEKQPGNLLEFDEIKKSVWPEREFTDINGVPNVDSNEIIRMIDRLRRKLGEYGGIIVSRRGFGYTLDESCVLNVEEND